MMRRITPPILLTVAIMLGAQLTIVAQPSTKLTPAAAQSLTTSAPSELKSYWLFLDTARIAFEPPQLTSKAIARRARVNRSTLLIDSKDARIPDSVLATISGTGARVRFASRWLKAVAVEVSPSALLALLSLPTIQSVDIVRTYVRSLPPRDVAAFRPGVELPYGNSQLQNEFIKATKLHRAGLSGKGILIALLDTGFNIHHPDFDSTHIVATYDFIHGSTVVDNPDCLTDPLLDQQTFHGTLTLSVLGGYTPDTMIGVAYGADYMLAKTEITCGGTEIKAEEINWIHAAEWADSAGADIISSSLGYTVFQDSGSYTPNQLDGKTALITQAAEIAASKNILVVVAAGNDRGTSWNHISFPADGDSVCAVGAVRSDSTLASFSSPGPTTDGRIKPDISTLGVAVTAAISVGGFGTASGTSLATPLVAGGAALGLEHDTTMTAAQMLALIRQTGSISGHPDNDFGYGLYDAAGAADIIKIDQHDTIYVHIKDTLDIVITSSGRSRIMPTLSLLSSPSGVSFADNHDGTGQLTIVGQLTNVGPGRLRLEVSVGYFADTTEIILWTYPKSSAPIIAYPNPFHDTLTIFIDSSNGTTRSTTIFNSAGEKVWQQVNQSAGAADIIRWDGRNYAGRKTAAGVYILLVETDRRTETIKLLKTQ